MQKIVCRLLAFSFFFFIASVYAQSSPIVMLQDTVDRFVKALNDNYSAIKSNPKVSHKLIKTIVLPKIDLNAMARSVVGSQVWSQASEVQKARFKEAFTDLIIRTYERAFVDYRYEKVQVFPLRDGDVNKDRLLVHSKVIRYGAAPVDLSFRLLRQSEDWKIYDLGVEGISLVQSYRSQFTGPLAKEGIDGLIQEINKRHT